MVPSSMRVLHYDCFAGLSGDMNLGAMVDLGVDFLRLREELGKLALPKGCFALEAVHSGRSGIHGTEVSVHCHEASDHGHDGDHHGHVHHHEHRSFADVAKLIADSALSERVKGDATAVFRKIAEAEARVHGKSVDEVHFHEVGAVDSIVDVVGAAVCWEMLDVDAVSCGRVELGSGHVHCAHGVMPVPAPATAILAEGFEVSIGGTDHEATTPTGMGLLAAMAGRRDGVLSGRVLATGIGVGHRHSERLPNVVRVSLLETAGEEEHSCRRTDALEVSVNLDDMTAEHVAYLAERLFAAGASDVWQEAIAMKKNRLGTKVTALCRPELEADMVRCMLVHSSSLGVRVARLSKYESARSQWECSFEGTPYRLKCREGDEAVRRSKVEFEDLKKLAERRGVSLEMMLCLLDECGGCGKEDAHD